MITTNRYFLVLILALSFLCVNCSTLEGLFKRHREPVVAEKTAEAPREEAAKRTTRRSMEEESMLGENSGSLWSGRGQASFLFTNNSQRLLGDPLPVNIDGYPKEQIQLKVNTIAKLLAQILNDQKQEIKVKEEKIQKENAPAPALPTGGAVEQRGLASTPAAGGKTDEVAMSPESQKEIRKIDDESEEIKSIQNSKEFIIRSVPTRVVDIQKDGAYRVKGEKVFMIGKREYKLNVNGIVKPEDFDDKGVSAEKLMEAQFDVTSDKKSEEL